MIRSLDPFKSSRQRAFTLIEIMISIAIVLALIIGVNQVFKVAADTVGTGMALSAKIRDGRAAQAVLYDELNHISREGPFLIISSGTQPAFETAIDEKSDLDYAGGATPPQKYARMLTIDMDGNNAEGEFNIPGEVIPATATNHRNHRVDMVSFFASNLYRRQTGNSAAGIYAADQSSNEAWVTYGHARVYDQAADPNVATSYPYPGALPGVTDPNPKNFYASDWVLGRMQYLLIPPVEDANVDGYNEVIWESPITTPAPPPTKKQRFWMRKDPSTSGKNGIEHIEHLEPLGPETQVDNGTAPTLADGRYDLIGTTFRDFKVILTEYIHLHSVLFDPALSARGTPNIDRAEWWDVLLEERFRSNPYPTAPLDALKVARTSPVMIPNCTQFIVEFAGDFVKQQYDMNGDGNIDASDWNHDDFGKLFDDGTGAQPDGIIDFLTVKDAGGNEIDRKVRWYGMPRDINDDGLILGTVRSGIGAPPSVTNANFLVDVVPLRDVMHTVYDKFTTPADQEKYKYGMPYERTVEFPTNYTAGGAIGKDFMPARNNYAAPNPNNQPGANFGMASTDRYVVAWGPNDSPADSPRPKMIRVIITLADPSGRISQGQTYEYVATLP